MTKDEFLDIMGSIDESIIDGVLDVPCTDKVRRSSALKYILYAAACIAVVFAVGSAVRYFNGSTFLPNSGTSDVSTSVVGISDNSDISDSSDSIDSDYPSVDDEHTGSWNPEEVINNSNPVLGGSAVFSTAELGELSVSLILHDITKLPGEEYSYNGYDYTDYWGAKDIVLYAKYNDVDGMMYTYEKMMEKVSEHYNGQEYFIHSKCLFDGSTRLFERKSGFPVLMQYIDYNTEKDAMTARYFAVYPKHIIGEIMEEKNPHYKGIEPFYINGIKRICSSWYSYQTSESIYRKDDSVLVDPEYGYELYFDDMYTAKLIYPDQMPEGYENIKLDDLRGWDPEKLEYDPYPEVGESAIVSTASAGDMTVSLVMLDVRKRPGEQHYSFPLENALNMWAAGEICVYVKDGDKRMIAYLPPTDGVCGSVFLFENQLFDGCIRLFRTETDGKTHYLLMMLYKDTSGSELVPLFYDIDIDFYTVKDKANDELKYQADETRKDENGIRYSLHYLQTIEVSADGIAGMNEGLRVSESFAHKEGTTFVDPVYGYEITFDMKNGTATVSYPNG